MILFISKKVIAIYGVNNLFLFIVFFSLSVNVQAQTNFHSYCFNQTVNLKEVQKSVEFLLLPRDVIELRDEDHCIDIITSSDRGKLFEKYLAERYNLKDDAKESEARTVSLESSSCRLDLKTTTKKNKTLKASSSVSMMELLLGIGQPEELELDTEKLKVICHMIGNESANLVFSYADKNKGSKSTEVRLKKGEWFNIALVIKDLNEKNKTLGIPQSAINNSTEKAETIYELQFK